jgi:hypothetical protein
MSDYCPDVTKALLAAGWTPTTLAEELRNGDAYWRPTTPAGDSAVWVQVKCIAEFRAYCPAIVIVAACLAAAGQPAERLADVIPLRPTP